MGLIDQLITPIEKLINEHGSATLLREHLNLVKAKAAEQESRNIKLESENAELKATLLQREGRVRELEQRLEALTNGHHNRFCCDACGSPQVRRTGSRPDPTFGVLGVKEGLFTCSACGHVSAFTMDA